MHVIYDATVIGGSLRDHVRTGVFRVVETMCGLLLEREDCEVEFSSMRNAAATAAYLASRFSTGQPRLTCTDYRLRVNVLHEEAAYHFHRTQGLPQFPWRVWRKTLNMVQNARNTHEYLIDPASLARADIYHSSFYFIPDQVQAAKHVHKFLTVFDLIPILYPQYFNNDPDHILHRVLASVGEEGSILAISEATKRDVCGHLNLEPERVFVTPLAADPRLFYPCADTQAREAVRTKYGITDAPYVLTLGTLEPRKNMDHVIRCFARLCREHAYDGINLVLTGSKGWDYDRIFGAIAQSPDIKNRIIWTGRVADEDLAALYSGAQAFLYMSLYEGFGLPPLEAMQCGVPVITSNTSSLPEVVGNAGILLAPDDADGLCQALLDLDRDDTLRAQMEQRSLERARLFSWERCAEQTVTAYKTVLERSNSRHAL